MQKQAYFFLPIRKYLRTLKVVQTKFVIESPCINYCKLDRNDFCLGCHRSVSEIIDWPSLSEDEKASVVEKCKIRAQQTKKAKEERRTRYISDKSKK